ncbi:Alcohol_dehydrogenase [Hexamita inflata]|uniref:Alcohol dehydrogenase n=1 Tax=Hexamita inflata TaxID=28002 RepID=A0AA86U2K1_9EUKA|nr:Alcohol dehydrogenase [Hexamita inflata]CAI9938052.1 Alcohol dehydrogenase [Hexamita inflata]
MSIQAFQWFNPTKLIVKHDASHEIADYIAADQIQSVLLVSGKGSVKKIGVYDQVVNALKAKRIIIYELSGVRANPEIKTVIQGIGICRKHSIQAVVPIGGGSSFDTAKGIACGAALSEQDLKSENAWEIYEGKVQITKALPIYGVLTISATGSEMNIGAVAQDDAQKKKYSFHSIHCFPKVSIVDPKLQAHLPWFQQVNGFVDAFMHICEFVTNMEDTEEAETTFALDLSLLRSIIKAGDKLQQNTNDHVARANFIWAATCALNQLSAVAMRGGCGAVHYMEHPLSAQDPSISHGAGLGVVFPAFVRANGERGLRLQMYDRMAKEVFGREGWQGVIDGFQTQLKKWGHPTSLNELFGREVGEEERIQLLEIFKKRPVCGHYPDMKLPEDIAADTYKYM